MIWRIYIRDLNDEVIRLETDSYLDAQEIVKTIVYNTTVKKITLEGEEKE